MSADWRSADEFDAESAVIGALMIGQDAAFARIAGLRAEHFSDEQHRWLFSLLSKMHSDRMPIDAVTIMSYLESRYPGEKGAQAAHYALSVANATPGAANISAYAGILLTRFENRRRSEIAFELQQNPTKEGAEQAMRDLLSLHTSEPNREHTMQAAVKEAWAEISAAFENGGALRGVTTGLKKLDDALGGFHRGDLIVIGARPAMGKTALLISMAQKADVPRGLISAEQSAGQIGQRAISMVSKVPVSNLRAGKIEELDWPRCTTAIATLAPQPCFIYDKPAPTLDEIVRISRRWKLDNKIQALYVDYIQRIKHGNARQPKHERVAEVTEGLKEIARELDIPVIALAQVKRDVEERTNKRPNMGDMADSSSIEKEADQIMMLYRDEVYNVDTTARGIAEISLEKNRHGPIGKIFVNFDGPTVTFSDLAKAA